ncbi:hypothetical protein BBP40_004051 [Aspergillus hancockii]|nr:hypothetical protein BBP40_004051 [Aspergillus hancockii]
MANTPSMRPFSFNISFSSTVQSSRPIGIPFPAQHQILIALQRQLERSGFNFAQARHPSLCQAQGWDCAEKVELHTLFRMLDREFRARPVAPEGKMTSGASRRLRKSIVGIRHAAVHRRPQRRRQLLQKFDAAVEFMTHWLGDQDTSLAIRRCRNRWSSLLDGYDESCHRLKLNLAARMDQCLNGDQECLKKQRRLQEAARRVAQQTVRQLIAQVEDVLHDNLSCL